MTIEVRTHEGGGGCNLRQANTVVRRNESDFYWTSRKCYAEIYTYSLFEIKKKVVHRLSKNAGHGVCTKTFVRYIAVASHMLLNARVECSVFIEFVKSCKIDSRPTRFKIQLAGTMCT